LKELKRGRTEKVGSSLFLLKTLTPYRFIVGNMSIMVVKTVGSRLFACVGFYRRRGKGKKRKKRLGDN